MANTQKLQFSNRGVVQKLDVNQLSDDQYANLLNMASDQEGSISPRPGYQQIQTTWDGTPPSNIVSIHATRNTFKSYPIVYAAEGTDLRRVTMSGVTSGTSDTIATGLNASSDPAYPITKPGLATYRDQYGNVTEFIGSDLKMLKDVNNTSTTALKWGILPPSVPATASPGAYTFVNIIKSGASGGFDLTGARIPTATYTVATATAITTGAGSDGYYSILATPTPGTLIGLMQPGMYIKVGSQDVIVDELDPATNTFKAYFGTAPSAGNTIDAYQSSASITANGATSTTVTSATFSPAVDASLNGDENDGYNGDDYIHIALLNEAPANLSEIRLRIMLDGSANDYYEKSILPSPAQNLQTSATVTADTTRADTTLNQYSRFTDTQVYGVTDSAENQQLQQDNISLAQPDLIATGLQPTSLNASVGSVWTEIDIPKSAFLRVGRAGTGRFSWKYITSIVAIVKSTSSSVTASVKFGSIFAYGGKGNNSGDSFNLLPYDYVYTYFDPKSGAESNPSQPVIPENAVRVVKQATIVKVRGTASTGSTANVTNIRVYRRGGTFVDGLYRLVGVVSNPGAGNYTYIEDATHDFDIIAAPTARFDNDPPITASLNTEITAVVLSKTYSAPFYTITFSNLSGLTDIRELITPGTTIFLGGANNNSPNTDIITVDSLGASANQLVVCCQYTPVDGSIMRCSAVKGVPAPIVLSALDRMWVAGDPYNPHILYSSKTGRPEAFPTINDVTGNAHQISVSSPDDAILGLCEYEGQIICFCAKSIYTVRLDNGRLDGPYKTPANRGIVTRGAFCRVDNEIWFISYDGIYAWSGGQIVKKSLAIDFLFKGREINGIPPISFNTGTLVGQMFPYQYLSLQQSANYVFMNYVGTDDLFKVVRYHLLFDRWSFDEIYDPDSAVLKDRNGYSMPLANLTALNYEPATGLLFIAKSRTSATNTLADIGWYDSTLRRDKYSGSSGVAIYSEARTKVFDLGDPMLNKLFTDIAVEYTVGDNTNQLKVGVYYDYSDTLNTLDTFDLDVTSSGRKIAPLPLQEATSNSTSSGKEARAVQFEVFGRQAAGYDYWHGINITHEPLAELQRGRIMDWQDGGYAHDKRYKTVAIEYDCGANSVDLILDYIGGTDGNTIVTDFQTLTLGGGTGRAEKTFAINDGLVAKMVRLRPKVTTDNYQIFGEPKWSFDPYPADTVLFTEYSDYGHQYEKRFYVLYLNVDTNNKGVTLVIEGDGVDKQTVVVSGTAANRMVSQAVNVDVIAKLVRLRVTDIPAGGKFQLFDHRFEKEDFPPEIVLSTDWTDWGYDFDKYAEQLTFDVNTNGYDIPVGVYGDGVLKQTVTVNTTQSTRNKNITLNPSLKFNIMRLQINPASIPTGGRFQLWGYKAIVRPADKGEVEHTFDWTDAGHPYDKKFVEMTLEFETQSAGIQIGIDTLTGIDGNVETINAKTFTITSAGRGYVTIPMLDNGGNEIVAKMVRVHSNGVGGSGSQSGDFKMWNPKFPGLIPYPPDKMPFTDWSDLGYSCDKIFRGLGLEMDTGGVNCAVYMDIDGVQADSWVINTTSTNRRVFLSPNSAPEKIGKQFRLRTSPGTNGKSQMFGQPNWDVVKDACEFTFFDTFEQAFGSVGYTVIKENWIDYKCAGTITVRFYTDDGVLFYTKQLPAHATRYPERFYLPSSYGGVKNKSKKHRITMTADDVTKPFKLYRDASRTEYINLSSDIRSAYYQSIIWQNIQVQV